MRLFAVGDIHGCATALEAILVAIDLHPGDKLVALGDYINKGTETKQVLDRLIQLYDHGLVVPLLGNHELKLLTAGKLKQTRVGDIVLLDAYTLKSYEPSASAADLSVIPDHHWRFVQEHCLNWVMADDYIFTHATLEPNKSLPHLKLDVVGGAGEGDDIANIAHAGHKLHQPFKAQAKPGVGHGAESGAESRYHQ
jgi:serine/threonine protein phosphatase 1